MKKFLASLLSVFSVAATSAELDSVEINSITNEKIKTYNFLEEMYQDDYFPNFLVDKGKNILLNLCLKIEKTKPENDKDIYALTHKSTEHFNDLAIDFMENDSDIETAAREAIAQDFENILKAYGYDNLDIEEAIAPRDW